MKQAPRPRGRLLSLCTSASLASLTLVPAPASAQCVLAWDSLAGGISSGSNVFALTSLGGGELLAGGQFAAIGGVTAARIARWNGSAWSSIGGGLAPFNAVYSVCRRPNGEWIAGGQEVPLSSPFVYANIARWDGAAWSPLGPGVTGSVYALSNLANGDLVAGGSIGFAAGQAVHCIARWDGAAWSPIGAGFDGLGPFTSVRTLVTLPNGDLIAGGNFTMSGVDPVLRVARWNGTSWTQVGAGFNGPVMSLLALPNGDLVAGGTFTASGGVALSRIARFDGSAWLPLGAGLGGNPNIATVDALAHLPNGDLVAGGLFQVDGAPLGGLARWNGSAWSPLGGGPDGYVAALAFQATGSLVAGGTFFGAVGRGVSRLSTPCPAAASGASSGCAVSSGHLEVASAAWVGSTWRAVADGLPPAALVFSVLGLSSVALPLSAVFETASPGCLLLVAPDDVSLRLTVGTLDVELAIPPSPALAGMHFHHQLASLALDASLSIGTTNALTMTVGAF
ncbi:MAG TPA: hypothetical protein VFZ65_08835 [Planctomycetota bacterium]|nr:hypothetical protein [Planctomycetota bacterium]